MNDLRTDAAAHKLGLTIALRAWGLTAAILATIAIVLTLTWWFI